MTVKCGICGEVIASHGVEESRGSHYTEHYETVERILHHDLGKVLSIEETEPLKKRILKLREAEEPILVRRMMRKNKVIIGNVDTIEKIGHLVGNLECVKRDVQNSIVYVTSAGVGRHKVSTWGAYIRVSNVDICRKCGENHLKVKTWKGESDDWHKSNSTTVLLDTLNELVPALQLAELNKQIWNDIKNQSVKIKLQRDY